MQEIKVHVTQSADIELTYNPLSDSLPHALWSVYTRSRGSLSVYCLMRNGTFFTECSVIYQHFFKEPSENHLGLFETLPT